MFLIGDLPVAGPLIFPVKQLYQAFWQYFFQASQQDNVILPVIVDPALITRFGVLTLDLAGLL